MNWFPWLPFGEGPRYLQIVGALRHDISTGLVTAGDRLPTHREMAAHLGLSIGTITKAYAAAERQGLISGQVGRGTFVLRQTPALSVASAGPAPNARQLNLALNAPPDTGEEKVIARAMCQVLANPDLKQLLSYLPHQGKFDHRETIAGWLSHRGMAADPTNVYITNGAQHAISLALGLLVPPSAPALAENHTYSGIIALAQFNGFVLRGVPMDKHGLKPDALDAALAESGARVLYCTPTLQAATGVTMPVERRAEIAEVVAHHDGWIVEDDAYGFLYPEPLTPLSAFLPNRSFYIVSFAKCLSPGLRLGAIVAPPVFHDRLINAIRATGWMANALMADTLAQIISSGELDAQIMLKRQAAGERMALAQKILGPVVPSTDTPGFHFWLGLPAGRSTEVLIGQAARAGLTIAATTPLQSTDGLNNGVRICLGGLPTLQDVEWALTSLKAILSKTDEMYFM